MLKVINVVGARPNFMKVAPIVAAMRRRPAKFLPLVVHTWQHYYASMPYSIFPDLELSQPDAAGFFTGELQGLPAPPLLRASLGQSFGDFTEVELPSPVIS